MEQIEQVKPAEFVMPLPANGVDISELRQVIATLREFQAMENECKREIAKLKEQIRVKIGLGRTGVLDGMPVYEYQGIDSVSTDAFKKAEPEAYEEFLEPTFAYELNIERLKKERRDLFEKYQTKRLQPLGPRP